MFTSTLGTPAGAATRRRLCVHGLLVLVVWITLTAGGCGGTTVPGDPEFLLAPEFVQYGATYTEWSIRWWQWVMELDRTNHPLRDLTGADALQAQVDPVWFLGGFLSSFGVPPPGTIVRDVTIPSGIALFFPIINFSWDNTNCLLPDTTYSFSELHNFVAASTVGVTNLECDVDGIVVLDSPDFVGASRFRAQSPAFRAILPADNIWFDFCGGVPLPPRSVDPVASDGIWMMVAPLPPGSHVIHFTGTPSGGGFAQDITYNLTVTP